MLATICNDKHRGRTEMERLKTTVAPLQKQFEQLGDVVEHLQTLVETNTGENNVFSKPEYITNI